MAWTVPKTWKPEMVTASDLNTQWRDNLNQLSTHSHDGTAGNGGTSLAIPTITANSFPFVEQSSNPASTGQVQRNGNNIFFNNGSAVVVLGGADVDVSTPSRRTLGTGALQASAGNHTH